MKIVKKLLCLTLVVLLCITVFSACPDDNNSDPIMDFYDTYQLKQLKYGYYDSSNSHRSGWAQLPLEHPFFGSTEQNTFFNEVLAILGESLIFTTENIQFSGSFSDAVPYTYIPYPGDGTFTLNFENILGAQENEIRKYISNGTTNVWKDYENKTIQSRVISIAATLYMHREGGLDFKPIAVFEFEYYKEY